LLKAILNDAVRLTERGISAQLIGRMRLLIAPDKFKGSLSALAAAEAIERGFRSVIPNCETDLAPIADGGEGFAEAMMAALRGEWISMASEDAIGRSITARYAWIDRDKLAVIEMSEASGLWRLKPDERSPLRADTYGTGLLLKDAIARGATRILVGLGGSATTDGGIGIARALDYRFVTENGEAFNLSPGDLIGLQEIVRPQRLTLPEIIAACDVQNPLLGERGTARVYAAQKGARPEHIEMLEAAMRRLADVCKQSLQRDHREVPGAGAAGGLGFGLLTFCDAQIQPGFDIVARTMRLQERIAAADLVITGEGRLDDQTLDGKGPAGIAAAARLAGKRVVAFGGAITEAAESARIFDALIPIADRPLPLETAIAEGAALLERAAARTARLITLS
jgi:glycerate kinase